MIAQRIARFCGLFVASWLAASLICAEDKVTDDKAIRHLMLKTWDKPGSHLQVDPVVVDGGFALASWIQGERGGRAILAKREGQWVVMVCTGDGALDARNLQQAGMPETVAEKLAAQLNAAEQHVPAGQRAKFSLFGADVLMHDSAGSHAQHSPSAH